LKVPARWQPFMQLIVARMREFYREPEVLFWVYGFPLILAIGLGIAFSGREAEQPAVDVQQSEGAATLARTLEAAGFTIEIHDGETCQARLVKGKTALYLRPEQGKNDTSDGPTAKLEYVYDPMRAECVLARYWVEAVLERPHAQGAPQAENIPVTEPGSRYIDFLLPGLVGMNLMGGGLFGVGFVLVDMRVRRLFKRLMATPMRHSDFLLALLTSRLIFLLPEMFALLVLGRLLFSVPINGSIVTLMVAVLLGAAAFAGLGLLLGCRTDKTETMSGYINLVMLPQYLLSGIFFSSSRFPAAVQPVIQALPLTQLNDALREVMLEGAGFAEVGWRLGILATWAVVCFALALRWFRWR
jgi:ABC-2 type transport system permease protein